MGFIDDAKDAAQTAGRKAKEAWEAAADRVGDRVDEVKADAQVRRAEAEKESVERRNDLKEQMRD